MFEVICKNKDCDIKDFVNKFIHNPIPVICGTCGEIPTVSETDEIWIEQSPIKEVE